MRRFVAHALADAVYSPPVTILVFHGIRMEDIPCSLEDVGNSRLLIGSGLGLRDLVALGELHIQPDQAILARDQKDEPNVRENAAGLSDVGEVRQRDDVCGCLSVYYVLNSCNCRLPRTPKTISELSPSILKSGNCLLTHECAPSAPMTYFA